MIVKSVKFEVNRWLETYHSRHSRLRGLSKGNAQFRSLSGAEIRCVWSARYAVLCAPFVRPEAASPARARFFIVHQRPEAGGERDSARFEPLPSPAARGQLGFSAGWRWPRRLTFPSVQIPDMLHQAAPCEGSCEICRVVTKWRGGWTKLRVRTIPLGGLIIPE